MRRMRSPPTMTCSPWSRGRGRHDRGARTASCRSLRRHHRPRAAHRAAGLDARGLPEHDDPPDRPARPFGDHRHAAGGELDHAGAVPAPQGDPARQGAGRGRARHVPVLRRGDPRRRPWRPDRQAHQRAAEVLLDLQLPGPELCRRGRDRVAGRRRRDLQPGPALPLLLRSLRTGDGAHLQGGVLPPAAGLRAAHDDDAGHAGATGDGAGIRRPVLVAVADDVRAAR